MKAMGTMKTDQVRMFLVKHDYKNALKVAKGFRLGINKNEQAQIVRAYECMVHPDFYQSIGADIGGEIDKGINILIRMYGTRTRKC